MAQLASSFEEYGAWRDALAVAIGDLRRWMQEARLAEPEACGRIDLALERLAQDKLMVAFVAEFSRGKSELINAIFFADYGCRILPSAAGRTTMCPTELLYDESLPPCIRALPIETRARSGTTSDFKRLSGEWHVFPLDTRSPEGMLEAFRLVAETCRVSVADARSLGLFDPEDPDQTAAVDAAGMIEISKWRHAVINFPHPLLQQGLVVLDTPGLNAIGTEPELTLSLVPRAHAVLFVLAADTGVTRSDLDVWRHIVTDGGSHHNHLAVLNKIDGLWDPLKTSAEIAEEVRRQVSSVASTLELDPMRVFAVSAQKGLVAKVNSNPKLLAASRLPVLEDALVRMLVPAKQRIVRDQTLGLIERVGGEVRQVLDARERGLIEQLYELRALQGKNQSQVGRMQARAEAESREFEDVVRRFFAARSVLGKLADEAYAPLRMDALRAQVLITRERMSKARLSLQLSGAVRDYFAGLRSQLRAANASLAEIEKMVLGVQRSFAAELGWGSTPPVSFSLDAAIAELDRAEQVFAVSFGPLAVITQHKWSLIERFFDTVVSRSREIFADSARAAENWVRSLLPPLEMQVREQRAQLKKRVEAITRIRQAQESLELRIGELESALEDVQGQLDRLARLSDRIRVLARRGSLRTAEAIAA
ncbi:MAG: dynamin family protein [Burkholderiaceae bacterium]